MSDTLELHEDVEVANELKFVRFQLGDEHFAFSVDSVTGIIKWREVTPLPNVEDHLLGLGNLRGRTLPVTDLRLKMGIESPVVKEDGLVIVTEDNHNSVGLLVDHVIEVLTVNENDIQENTVDISNDIQGYVTGIVNVKDVLISILDLEKLVEVAA
ncbi:MAG: purine-binding chemotaxis protein CheW [Armatimonadetes bacterium]|nr:hypothetical protein [Armatimonadota bacterium]MBS1700365.1 purine-binding chemotaxis protein CheW [Armatimonadota bacterium]MBS1725422.1 purine-binding chemotaxis protein CheW [Armatimonadota bacterium]